MSDPIQVAEAPKNKPGRPAKKKSEVEFPTEPNPKHLKMVTPQEKGVLHDVTEEDETPNLESNYVRFYHYGYAKPCIRYFDDVEDAKEFCANENNRWRVQKGFIKGSDGQRTPQIVEMLPFFINEEELENHLEDKRIGF